MKLKYFKNDFQESDGVLIFNESDEYVSNFGKQWRDHTATQIDSMNNFSISLDLLENLLFNKISSLHGKTVIELGSGAGRFTEYLVKEASECVSVDLSQAIFFNVSKGCKNLTLIKSDFTALDVDQEFDVVICRGVLQHTPDPRRSILKLFEFAKDGGEIFFDIYTTPKLGMLSPKYLIWRPFFKRFIKYETYESFLRQHIAKLLKVKRILQKILFNSKFLSDSLIPIYDYQGIMNINEEQLESMAILDTLDGMYAFYDQPMTQSQVTKLITDAGFDLLKKGKDGTYYCRKKSI
ncbi:class I SAM-dependent methyltransferase [Gammaproteobacteria bacterium]|nr:class I SAM-dependent methyltransferase [Gammaproteobacteria bacterium]